MIHGAFSEMEISIIAKQLLEQVKIYHDNGISLYHINPQSILVQDGFRENSVISLQISHAAPMIVA